MKVWTILEVLCQNKVAATLCRTDDLPFFPRRGDRIVYPNDDDAVTVASSAWNMRMAEARVCIQSFVTKVGSLEAALRIAIPVDKFIEYLADCESSGWEVEDFTHYDDGDEAEQKVRYAWFDRKKVNG